MQTIGLREIFLLIWTLLPKSLVNKEQIAYCNYINQKLLVKLELIFVSSPPYSPNHKLTKSLFISTITLNINRPNY